MGQDNEIRGDKKETQHLKKSFPKDNYPTPFTNHVIDECVGHKILYLMDGFS
jgi:hypothetical protein